MMPEWHQLVPMSGHVEESETAKKIANYTRLSCLHPRHLDYRFIFQKRKQLILVFHRNWVAITHWSFLGDYNAQTSVRKMC